MPTLLLRNIHTLATMDGQRREIRNAGFVDWLRNLYPRWRLLRPPIIQMAVEVGLTEMALSGCTTVADHNYLWPNGLTAKHLVDTARSVGLRFHLGHGFQNISVKDGGFAPDELAESDD